MAQSGTISAARSRLARLGLVLGALILPACPSWVVRADDIYKSVDSEGHVVYSDRPDGTARIGPAPNDDLEMPPRAIHFCWTNCFTLELGADGQYRRADGTEETWSVESFTEQAVVLHRHDPPANWNGFSADVTYAGQVSEERLINVTVNGRPTAGIVASWGPALDTLPGTNAERDRRQSAALNGAADAPSEVGGGMDMQMSAAEAPPPLPDEQQPPCTEEGFLWTPGYWAAGDQGYYWVPGLWASPPRAGLLWTPGYWGFVGSVYVFHRGYWGPHVGYYGGINYGFGYGGTGYSGGRWVGNSFAYNRSVTNVNSDLIHHTYGETPPSTGAVQAGGARAGAVQMAGAVRVSYNGGLGGIRAVPTAEEKAAAAEPHLAPTPLQRQLVPAQTVRPSAQTSAVLVQIHAPRPATPPTHGAAALETATASGASGTARPHAVTTQTARSAPLAAPLVRSERRVPQSPTEMPPAQEGAGKPAAPRTPSRPARAEPLKH